MTERSLLFEYQKQKVERKKQEFTIDKLGRYWASATDANKRLLLKLADFDLTPKHWGGYSKQEQQTLHSCALWVEVCGEGFKASRKASLTFEKRINGRD